MRLILSLLLVVCCKLDYAQSLNDVINSKTITWYGIDFSEARFINFKDNLNVKDLKNGLIESWSWNPLTESDKRYIMQKYSKNTLNIELSSSQRRNNSAKYKSRIVTEGYDFDIDTIKKIIADYEIKGKGYGVLIIVEGFEAIDDRGFIWVVFINNPDKKIIAAKRYVCDATTGNIENRWQGAITNAIKYSSNYIRSIR